MKEQYSFQDFLSIIEQLRSENGCPWDKEQTHESLRPCMMEEAAELVASVRILKETGNYENLKEELGDVLLQVALHSQIAKEEGFFSFDDVITEVSRKMIRRHPHVFGTDQADTSEEVLRNWDDIKKKEKEGKDIKTIELSEIPLELPSLVRAQKIAKKTRKLHATEDTYDESLAQIKELLTVLEKEKEDMSQDKLQNTLGELLYSLSDMAGIAGIHAEQALMDVVSSKIAEYKTLV